MSTYPPLTEALTRERPSRPGELMKAAKARVAEALAAATKARWGA